MFESSKFDKSGLKSGGHIRPGPDLKKQPDSGRGRIWYPVQPYYFSLQCIDTVGWPTGRAFGLWKTGCWFAGGGILTGALHILWLQLFAPPPSPLAPIKSRMETCLYQLLKWSLPYPLLGVGDDMSEPMVRFSILCQADQVWDGHARPIYCYSLNVCRYMRRRARRSRVKEPNNTL